MQSSAGQMLAGRRQHCRQQRQKRWIYCLIRSCTVRDWRHLFMASGVASFGKCVPKSSCEDMDCEPLLELDGSITATTCAAVCCPSDMCNELPVAIPSPSSVPSLGVLFYHLSHLLAYIGEGLFVFLYVGSPVSLCDLYCNLWIRV